MTAFFVSQRMHELGIRVALGATRRALLRMILGRGMRLTLAGLILGIAGASHCAPAQARSSKAFPPTTP